MKRHLAVVIAELHREKPNLYETNTKKKQTIVRENGTSTAFVYENQQVVTRKQGKLKL